MARNDAGGRDQLITIETPATAADGYGGGSVTWSTHVTAWVSIRPVQAREGERQGAERESCLYVIDGLRDELKAVTGAMRINWRGSYLNIREVRLPPETQLMMRLVAESGVTV